MENVRGRAARASSYVYRVPHRRAIGHAAAKAVAAISRCPSGHAVVVTVRDALDLVDDPVGRSSRRSDHDLTLPPLNCVPLRKGIDLDRIQADQFNRARIPSRMLKWALLHKSGRWTK